MCLGIEHIIGFEVVIVIRSYIVVVVVVVVVAAAAAAIVTVGTVAAGRTQMLGVLVLCFVGFIQVHLVNRTPRCRISISIIIIIIIAVVVVVVVWIFETGMTTSRSMMNPIQLLLLL
jgi:hypothetical protein